MPNDICLFEDPKYTQLLPLAHFRPVYYLKCGARSLKEKVESAYPHSTVILHCREYLQDVVKGENAGVAVNELRGRASLFINGRVVVDAAFAKTIRAEGPDRVYLHDGDVVAARVSGGNLKRIASSLRGPIAASVFDGLPSEEVPALLIHYPFDLVRNNEAQLRSDIASLAANRKGKKMKGRLAPGVHLVGRREIFIAEGSTVAPGTVVDASGGPVYLARGVTVMANSTIVGPAFVGEGSTIKVGAKIYEGTSIGPHCKVGGEVEVSIIDRYSNKQHDGFLGHSYLGAWVNLGAGTTNSDLKNNYSSVDVIIDGKSVDSGEQFVGVTIGDHTKTAINTVFNTGTVVGAVSNVIAQGFPPKVIPSFAWGGSAGTFAVHDPARALETASRVMARRRVILSKEEAALFGIVFEMTREERRRSGVLEQDATGAISR